MSEQNRPVKKKRGERTIATFDSTTISVHWNLAVAMILIGLLISFWIRLRYTELGPYSVVGVTFAVLSVIGISLLGRELAQTQIAKGHGLTVPTLSLSAIGARIRADSVPPYPRAEFQISGGGLLFTCSTALVLFGLAALSDYYRLNPGFGEVFTLLAFMNVILILVNLVPVAPLDAGRMATAFLWHRGGSRYAGQVAAGKLTIRSGVLLAVLGLGLIFFSIPAGFVLVSIAGLVAVVGRTQMRRASVRHRLETTTIADIVIKNPLSLPDSLTVDRLNSWANSEQVGVAHPVIRWDNNPIGYIVPTFAASLSEAERSWTRLDRLMQTKEDVDRCWSGEVVEEVLRRVPLMASTIVVVHDPLTMHEVGTVSYTQLQKLLIPPDFWGRLRIWSRSPVPQTTIR